MPPSFLIFATARTNTASEGEFPILPGEVLTEPVLFVDAPGGAEHAVSPERGVFVGTALGETDALFDKAGA
jgi:hypothetical protein